MSRGDWTLRLAPRGDASVRLFCFPHIGGGASAFRHWPAAVPPYVDVCSVQLPGRESRLGEEPIRRMEDLVVALHAGLRDALDLPFAFFGHSLGALVAFELARRLRETASAMPVHLFVSAHRAPQLPLEVPLGAGSGGDDLVGRLKRVGGTSSEVLANPELLELVMPALRADSELWKAYVYRPQDPLETPISTFGGVADVWVRRAQLERWREQTTVAFKLRLLPGGHFFLRERRGLSLLLGALVADLAEHRRERHSGDPPR